MKYNPFRVNPIREGKGINPILYPTNPYIRVRTASNGILRLYYLLNKNLHLFFVAGCNLYGMGVGFLASTASLPWQPSPANATGSSFRAVVAQPSPSGASRTARSEK